MKRNQPTTIQKCIFTAGVLGLLFFLTGGYLLDDLHLAPLFGLRTEWSKPIIHQERVEPVRYQCDTVLYQIEEGGAGGVAVTLKLMRDGNEVLQVGGDETTFIGFKDIDGDGTNEVLVASLGKWASKGVWKFKGPGFTKVEENYKASVFLALARCLARAKLGILVSLLLGAWGVAGILRPKRSD